MAATTSASANPFRATTNPYQYSTANGMLYTVLEVQKAGMDRVCKSKDWWIVVFLHFVVVLAYRAGIIPEDIRKDKSSAWYFDWNDMKIISAIALFQLVFNSVQVYKRYDKLHHQSMKLLMNVIRLTWYSRIFCGRTCYQYVALSSRYHVAAAAIFFENMALRKADRDDFTQSLSLHILNVDEKVYLEQFPPEFRPYLLMQWVCDILQEGFCITRENEPLSSIKKDSNLKAMLVTAEKSMHWFQQVADLRKCPTPFQVYHCMNLMVLVCICMWAYIMALSNSISASLIYLGAACIFLNAERVARRLQDPFGGQHRLNFPTHEWVGEIMVIVRLMLKMDENGLADWDTKTQQEEVWETRAARNAAKAVGVYVEAAEDDRQQPLLTAEPSSPRGCLPTESSAAAVQAIIRERLEYRTTSRECARVTSPRDSPRGTKSPRQQEPFNAAVEGRGYAALKQIGDEGLALPASTGPAPNPDAVQIPVRAARQE